MTASTIPSAELALRDIAMAYPEAHEDFPWGERAIKIKGKVFVFMHASPESLSLTTKLPASSEMALLLPYVSPTGYGLGKSGWVSAKFGPHDEVPIEMLRAWIDESFRAVAPKKVAALLAAPEHASPAKPGKTGGAKKVTRTGAAKKVAKTSAVAKTIAKTGAVAKKVAKTGAVAKKVAKTGAAKKVAKTGAVAKKVAKTGAEKKVAKAGKTPLVAKKAAKAGAVKARLVRA